MLNAYWKARVIIYFQFIDFDLWLYVENGLHRSIKIENSIEIPKTRSEYMNNDKKLLHMDAKAMNTLYCALSKSGLNRHTSCKNTRDIWHAL
jgi:hypothetical protein